MNKDVNKLGSWKSQLSKLKEKRRNFVLQYKRLMDEFKLLNKKIIGLNRKIDAYNKSDFHLSDHFILRFRERVKKDITIPEMKVLIFNERFLNCVKILENGEFPCEILGKEYFIIVKNKFLITILNGSESERNNSQGI